MIRKFPGQVRFGLYSRKTGRLLGTFPSRKKAIERERQINYFKSR